MNALNPTYFQQRVEPQASWLRWALALSFGVLFIGLAWDPVDRKTWLLENLLALPLAIWLIVRWDRLALSRESYLMLFAFLALHEVGSHFTYSLVPLPDLPVIETDRNHFDRAIHFGFGLVFTRPLAELLGQALGSPPRRLLLVLSVSVILALSAYYELLEWMAAVTVQPEQGIAFVGAQGDIWDAQKDTALAALGAALAALLLLRSLRFSPVKKVPNSGRVRHDE